MKNLKMIAMMMFVAMACVSFTGCGDDDDDAPVSAIVGKWTQTNSYGTVIDVTFNADQTGVYEYRYSNSASGGYEYFEYDYWPEEREVYISGPSGFQFNGSWDVSITANTLVLSGWDSDGYVEYHLKRK